LRSLNGNGGAVGGKRKRAAPGEGILRKQLQIGTSPDEPLCRLGVGGNKKGGRDGKRADPQVLRHDGQGNGFSVCFSVKSRRTWRTKAKGTDLKNEGDSTQLKVCFFKSPGNMRKTPDPYGPKRGKKEGGKGKYRNDGEKGSSNAQEQRQSTQIK